MTPAEFDLLCWRHDERWRQSFAPAAMLASIYVNAHLKEGAKETQPADFIPGAKEEQRVRFRPGDIPITMAQMKAMFAKVTQKG